MDERACGIVCPKVKTEADRFADSLAETGNLMASKNPFKFFSGALMYIKNQRGLNEALKRNEVNRKVDECLGPVPQNPLDPSSPLVCGLDVRSELAENVINGAK